MEIIITLLLVVFSFFVGSMPFSYILPKVMKGIDIRTVGSKNVGATNVYRNCGWFAGLMAAFLDIFKGAIVYFISLLIYPDYALALAMISVVGHCYTPWLNFKGGKGVATAAGVLLVYNYKIVIIMFIVFVLVIIFTRYVALASIISCLIAPFLNYVFSFKVPETLVILITALFIVFRHSSNIKRLLAGEEKKI